VAVISNATTIADAGAFSASLGSMVHIKTLNFSNTSTVSFVGGAASVVLDNTYPVYVFKILNIHPETGDRQFMFQGSVNGGSNYNVTMTSTNFYTYYGGGTAYFETSNADDQTQGTDFQRISTTVRTDNDACCSGELTIFNPSNTTFVKHFISKVHAYNQDNASATTYAGGYFNTTSALNAFQFKHRAGNITGTIKLYGIKDS
jgi:hypothetical protein